LRADHTVARYGGDEFAVIAEHPSGTGETLAARVHELAKTPLVLARHTLQPQLQLSWVTSNGQVGVHSMLDSAEKRLRENSPQPEVPLQRRRA
jgi:GGDEF domain-containing protein